MNREGSGRGQVRSGEQIGRDRAPPLHRTVRAKHAQPRIHRRYPVPLPGVARQMWQLRSGLQQQMPREGCRTALAAKGVGSAGVGPCAHGVFASRGEGSVPVWWGVQCSAWSRTLPMLPAFLCGWQICAVQGACPLSRKGLHTGLSPANALRWRFGKLRRHSRPPGIPGTMRRLQGTTHSEPHRSHRRGEQIESIPLRQAQCNPHP